MRHALLAAAVAALLLGGIAAAVHYSTAPRVEIGGSATTAEVRIVGGPEETRKTVTLPTTEYLPDGVIGAVFVDGDGSGTVKCATLDATRNSGANGRGFVACLFDTTGDDR